MLAKEIVATSQPAASLIRKPVDKIKQIPELASIIRQAQRRGCEVVHAHGAFDLLHLGHVRHLQQAREHGHLLVVTITADKYINKGPGRPVFVETMRAEMLAALEYVDWVGISYASDAVNLISTLQADVYIKGVEYAKAEDDVTGMIAPEQQAVEAHGGRLEFTEEIVFSSSNLINRHMSGQGSEVEEYIASIREDGLLENMLIALDRVKDLKVLVVGETIIDEYNYVSTMGKAAKESIIVSEFKNREVFAGGVIAAANHVAGICKQVDVVTCLGSQNSYEKLVGKSVKDNISLTTLVREGSPTICKSRFVEPGTIRKLFEVYYIDDTPVEKDLADQLNDVLGKRVEDYDLVLVTDFGHGLITESTVDLLSEKARFLAVNTQTNSANTGFNLITKYSRADYICIDAPEARLATGEKFEEIEKVAKDILPSMIDCDKLVITHGSHGCIAYERGKETHRVPAFTRDVVDTMGAGDAFLAVSSPLVAAGVPIHTSSFIGNMAGALKVRSVGHRRSVDKVDLSKAVTAFLK